MYPPVWPLLRRAVRAVGANELLGVVTIMARDYRDELNGRIESSVT